MKGKLVSPVIIKGPQDPLPPTQEELSQLFMSWGMDVPEDWDFWETFDDEADTCEHVWVGSGNPHGMVFCKICDIDHDKSRHGEVVF